MKNFIVGLVLALVCFSSAEGGVSGTDVAAQPLDSDLTAVAALSTTSFGRSTLALANGASGRALFGAGTSSFDGAWGSLSGKPTTIVGFGITDFYSLGNDAWQAANGNLTTFGAIAPSADVQTFLGAANYAAMKTQLALTIGTNVQAFDTDLTTWAGITPGSNWATLLAAARPTTLAGYSIADGQPLDSDLTAIAALATTSNGRSLLTASALTAAGLGLTNGAGIDAIGAKTAPSGTIVGTSDAQDLTAKHYSAPAIGSIAAGAALPSPTTLTVSGNDSQCLITIQPSATGGTSGITCTVTFGRAYTSAPQVALVPYNANGFTVQNSTKALTVGTITTTTFDINAGTVGLVSGTSFQLKAIISGP